MLAIIIRDMFAKNDVTVSFEVFPPKQDMGFASVQQAVTQLSKLSPHYMSVTCGAGGSTGGNTVAIAKLLQELGTTALAHLTCVDATRAQIAQRLAQMQAAGIRNVLALRGDLPQDRAFPVQDGFHYAAELVACIKEAGTFCVGAACYPEGHTQCANKSQDLQHLKQKVDAGCDFLVTQMFFDNTVLYSFLYNALKIGIDVPITAGIMPVTNPRQIDRMRLLSGATLSARLVSILDRFGDNEAALKQAGIAYAIDQIVDLVANGVRGIHIYTMNKPDVAQQICESLSEIL